MTSKSDTSKKTSTHTNTNTEKVISMLQKFNAVATKAPIASPVLSRKVPSSATSSPLPSMKIIGHGVIGHIDDNIASPMKEKQKDAPSKEALKSPLPATVRQTHAMEISHQPTEHEAEDDSLDVPFTQVEPKKARTGLGKGKGKLLTTLHKRHNHMKVRGIKSIITKPAVTRFMRRCGVPRISSDGVTAARATIVSFTRRILHNVLLYTECRGKKTIKGGDVIEAAKSLGMQLYAEEIQSTHHKMPAHLKLALLHKRNDAAAKKRAQGKNEKQADTQKDEVMNTST